MVAAIQVPPADTWKLDVSVSFENAEPNSTAEFTATFHLVGTPSVHSSSSTTVDGFMTLLVEAMETVPNRDVHLTLTRLSVAADEIVAT